MSEKRRDDAVTLPVTLRGSHHRVWGLAIGILALALLVAFVRVIATGWALNSGVPIGYGILIFCGLALLGSGALMARRSTLVVLSQTVYDVMAPVSAAGKSYTSPPVEAPAAIDSGFRILRAAHQAAVDP